MKLTDYIQRAYDITDNMSVRGGAVEQMAELRQVLREAYAAARHTETSEEDDGK